jgi:hypothetical protein
MAVWGSASVAEGAMSAEAGSEVQTASIFVLGDGYEDV